MGIKVELNSWIYLDRLRSFLRGGMIGLLSVAMIQIPGCVQEPKNGTNDSSLEAVSFSADLKIETANQLIERIKKDEKGLFVDGYLEENLQFFHDLNAYIGDEQQIDSADLNLMRQFIYFEIYKVRRAEFLLINLAKSLSLKLKAEVSSIILFDKAIPDAELVNYPNLKATKSQLKAMLSSNWKEGNKVVETRQFLRGSIEASYLARVVLNKRAEFLDLRYDENDDRYISEKKEIEGWQTVLKSSNSLLLTKPFQKLVEPYFAEEALESANLREAAINRFNSNFRAFVVDHQKITDLADYIAGDELIELGKALANSLKVTSQMGFRTRIKEAFDLGIDDTISNLVVTLDKHWSEIMTHDTANSLDMAYNQSRTDSRKFPKMLINAFREQAIHWIIIEEYSYLQSASEALSNLASQELIRQGHSRKKRYAAMAAVLALSPMASMKNGGWLGKTFVNIMKVGFLAAEVGIASTFVYESYKKYIDWKNIRRLVRLSVESNGLNSIVQENTAYWGMMTQFAVSGFSIGLAAMSSSKFLKGPAKLDANKGFISEIAGSTWKNNSQFTVKELRADLAINIKSLVASIKGVSNKTIGSSLAAISSDLAIFGTQLVVTPFAVLPNAVKATLSSIPAQVYQGASLGAVMGVMGVTVQHYITASGLRMFTYAFEKLGFTPPTVWKANGLNAEFRTQRDIMINSTSELTWLKAEISKLSGMIAVWENSLSSADLTASQKANIRSAIAGAESSIKNFLRLQLVRWYKRPEYRPIYNSSMKAMGFGMVVTPSMAAPDRMVITLRMGDKLLSHSLRASTVDDIIERLVDFDDAYSSDELTNLARSVGITDAESLDHLDEQTPNVLPR